MPGFLFKLPSLMMKVGSLVRIVGSHAHCIATIIAPWKVGGWWEVLTQQGQIIHWPESQMELMNGS